MSLRWHLWALPLLLAACDSGSSSTSAAPPATRLIVDPAAFLGELPCADAPGAVRSYQATLVDVTEGLDEAFTLPSSGVVSCTSRVGFDFVTPGRRYIAQVRVFSEPGLSVERPGVPLVVDGEGNRVSPQWTTTCWGEDGVDYGLGGAGGAGGAGGGPGSVQLGVASYDDTEVVIGGCEPLSDEPPTAGTAISVSLESALVGLTCGDNSGQVSTFAVQWPDSALIDDESSSLTLDTGAGGAGGASGATTSVTACGETTLATGFEPGVQLELSVTAFEAGATAPTWETTCRARTVGGVLVPASCDPLARL